MSETAKPFDPTSLVRACVTPLPIVRDLIRAARDRLARGWTQKTYARDHFIGSPVCPGSPAATCWCSTGALQASLPPEPAPFEQLADAFLVLEFVRTGRLPDDPGTRLVLWNDQPLRTQVEVVALFTKADEVLTRIIDASPAADPVSV